jgi:PAS domain S-box-containing protein
MDPIRVLVVDDEPAMATVTGIFLEERTGCTCETCTSAKDALRTLESSTFDIIVSDYQMPGMDGIEFLKTVRERPEYIPFILFTGRSREEVVIEALNNGADFYLQKGTDPEAQFAELAHMVRHAVEQKRSKDALLTSESLTRVILDNVSENVVFQDTECRIIWANRAAQYSAGNLEEDVTGRYCYEVLRKRSQMCENCVAQKAIDTGEPHATLTRLPGGGELILRCAPVRDTEEHIIGVVKTGLELTVLKTIESERMRSKEQLDLALEAANLATWNWYPAERRVLYSDSYAAMLGYAPDGLELRKSTFAHMVHPEDLPATERAIREHFSGNTPYARAEFRMRCRDGAWKWIHACGRVIQRDDGGEPLRMVGVHQDITAKKQLEAQIIAGRDLAFGLAGASSLEEAFSLCVRYAMDISGMDSGGLFLYDESDGALTLVHTVGLSDAFVRKETETQRNPETIRQVLWGGPKYHGVMDLNDHLRQLIEEEEIRACAVLPLLFEGRPIGCINIASHTREEIPAWCRQALEAMTAEIGSAIVRIQTREALKESNEALKSANHALNLLSSITRHDILNQVTAMKAYLVLLEEEAHENPRAREFCGRMKEIADTIRRQIAFTGDYQQMGEKNPEWQHVEWAVKRAAESAIANGIRLNVTTGPLEVFADPILEKAFFNLLENAASHGQHITGIEVSFREEEEGHGLLIFEDDGVGVAGDMKQQIFEKGVGANTGYGLYLVREILGITGVIIRETGQEGKGARFELRIPEGKWRTGSVPL